MRAVTVRLCIPGSPPQTSPLPFIKKFDRGISMDISLSSSEKNTSASSIESWLDSFKKVSNKNISSSTLNKSLSMLLQACMRETLRYTAIKDLTKAFKNLKCDLLIKKSRHLRTLPVISCNFLQIAKRLTQISCCSLMRFSLRFPGLSENN